MRYVLLTLLLCSASLLSCNKEDIRASKRIDFQYFRLTVPDDWNTFSLQSYDSQVGGITNGTDTLYYDYGWYSYNFKDQTAATHNRTTTLIDGRSSLIVQPKNRGKGIIGVFIEVDSLTKLSLYGNNIKSEATVLNIFKSIDVD